MNQNYDLGKLFLWLVLALDLDRIKPEMMIFLVLAHQLEKCLLVPCVEQMICREMKRMMSTSISRTSEKRCKRNKRVSLIRTINHSTSDVDLVKECVRHVVARNPTTISIKVDALARRIELGSQLLGPFLFHSRRGIIL
jgi:hypothetical protein